ncbi:PREDICTED: uncharacterized protein LOC104738503 [Camelina sativa]|uniref:Uncharacterized protein LOC104738503 n=1 Tax=Camelina sativa TaxID=90675 RepID=A0ABM0VJ08_CAMSA|nr:PREDICTED: uncharacterized protein LOC104738503 [Camelina sativa]
MNSEPPVEEETEPVLEGVEKAVPSSEEPEVEGVVKEIEKDVEQNGEDQEAKQHETAGNSHEECLTEQSKKKKKRRTRGPTRMSKVAKSHEDKVDVEFNSLGDHVGKGSVTLSSFLGALVREHVPVLIEDWRLLDEKTKDTMWEEIQGRFILTEEWQNSSVLMQMGCSWRATKSRLVRKLRATRSKEDIRNLKPSNIPSESAWFKWVKSRTSQSFKERSDRYRSLRRKQIPHTTSRKGMVRLAHEMKKKASDPSKITRRKIWIDGHTHADGRPVKPEFEQTIEQIKSLEREIGSNSNVSLKEDDVSQILGKDKSGRVRGMGRGVTATKLAFLLARDAYVQKIEARQAELVSKIADLKHMVRDLTKEKRRQQDDGAYSDTTDKI